MTTLARVRQVLAAHVPRVEDAPEARPAAVALVLLEGARGLELLLIKRAERQGDPWSGQIALPGGRRDPSDADLLATALRETLEETGVDLARAERLGTLDDLYPRTPVLPPVVVRPYVFALAKRPTLSLSAEVRDAFWVPLAALRAPGVRRDTVVAVRGVELIFPAYHHGGHVVWGMTERILTPFLDMVG
ncbi:MAG: NUDIX hydrolase [Gemmatimonadales bacterium]